METGRSRSTVTADAYGPTNPGVRRSLASRPPYRKPDTGPIANAVLSSSLSSERNRSQHRGEADLGYEQNAGVSGRIRVRFSPTACASLGGTLYARVADHPTEPSGPHPRSAGRA